MPSTTNIDFVSINNPIDWLQAAQFQPLYENLVV